MPSFNHLSKIEWGGILAGVTEPYRDRYPEGI
jgi:hypothetical protein